MGWEKSVFFGLMAGMLLSVGAGAQVPVQRPPGTTVPPGPGARRGRVEPCWEVAGISKSAMQQRRLVAEEARQQVEAVCANASLSPAQKREDIRQIRERERQQMEGLITPAQQEALRDCQESRGHGAVPHPGHAHPMGPCGELASPKHPLAEDEDSEKPQKAEPRPN